MSSYSLTPQARTDLFELWDYVADQAGIDRADHVVDEIESAMRRIADMPGIGHERDDLADATLRVWPLWSFLIVYRPDNRPLEVVRILHGSRDLRGIFRP